jgi:acetylornithine/N-succinyldiaminopimelate aminotransferase
VSASGDWMMNTYKRWPVEFETGRGAILYDTRGRPYIDLVGGIAVATVGHCHPAVVSAISGQAERLIHASNLYSTGPQAALAHRLGELTGGMRSFFCNSGAEAIECALKLARKWGRDRGRNRIIAAASSFHGRTLGALAATGQPAKQEPFAPMLEGIDHVPFGDAPALGEALGSDVAAVVLEPIQGEAGVIVPPAGYLAAVRALCDAAGALLVLDEIQTGLARTGAWFAYQHDDVAPDVLCLAKALAGGLPMGACLAAPEVADAFVPGDHATTFGGGPVQSAAALATLGVIESEALVARAGELGRRAHARLEGVFGMGRVRGRGLLIGIELERPLARAVAAAALDAGVLVNDCTSHVVRLAPPLVITEDELDDALTVLEKAWGDVRATEGVIR